MRIGKVEVLPWLKTAYNNSQYSERMIEIPIMVWFINRYNGRCFQDQYITEVGAVSPYYLSKITHAVCDPFDPHESCIRKTAEEIDYSNKLLLSISTIEHIGRGDYGQPISPGAAIPVLESMMRAKRYLITWASAQNTLLDNYAEYLSNVIKLRRTGDLTWEECSTLKNVAYGTPYPFGNGVYVITNCQELFPDKLTIKKASYGTLDSQLDVLPLLQQYIEDGSFLTLSIDSRTLGGQDPSPGNKKSLWIQYSYNMEIFEREVQEGDLLTIGEL